MRRLIVARRVSQFFCLLLFIYILWSTTYPLQGRLSADTFFKINPLTMIIASISERIILPGLILSLLLLVLTVIFGRFFCGWVCPLGTSIDIAGAMRKRIQPPEKAIMRRLSLIKFVILALIMIFAFLGYQFSWFLDPIVIMARFVSLNFIPAITLAIEQVFITLIKTFHMRGVVMDIYQALKVSMLGIKPYYFAHTFFIAVFFLLILAVSLWKKRFWCRFICPLGALFALPAKFSWLRRTVQKCNNCGICQSQCRMDAIANNQAYSASECILCMDCLYDCPSSKTKFKFVSLKEIKKEGPSEMQPGITRRNFLLFILLSGFSLGFRNRQRSGRNDRNSSGIIRPPAALNEDSFINRCIRCGNCMKVCITNGLQPVLFQAGLEGIWTPHLVPEIGYCEYNCTLCGNVCPTGAIAKLSVVEKQKTKLGLARINRNICLPWALDKECIVCQEHCPVFSKAIKLKNVMRNGKVIARPFVDERLCVGCGICQFKCPARPIRAIKVS